jgi:hypothetical protein
VVPEDEFMRSKTTLAGGLALLLLTGCAKHTTRPEIPAAEFSLVGGPSSGSPASPVEFTARVKVLSPDVSASTGCDAGPISFTLEDADGHRVNTTDPCVALPACPSGWGPLGQGTELRVTFRFAGVVFPESVTQCPAAVTAAPSGRYTLRAVFTYSLTPSFPIEPKQQERAASFDWDSGPDKH